MKVLTYHKWHDPEIEFVSDTYAKDVLEILIKDEVEHIGSVLIHKKDVIALAFQFDLVVYPKDANL